MDIEIWSDIACPWCYIGKRRFEAALELFQHRDDVNVRWRSFELDPEAPAERTGDRAEHLARKYGMTVEQARAAEQRITQTAADDGLEYRLDIARAGNTFDAHRLIHFAAEHGLQDECKERLLRAYFTEGDLISDHETLVRVAGEIGLPQDEAREMLQSDRFADAVRGDEVTAQRLGISAVPTFVIDRALGASGAHPPEELLTLLQRGWESRAIAPAGPA